jgi:hypothetical protein
VAAFLFSLLISIPVFSEGKAPNKCEECVVAHYNCKMKYVNQAEVKKHNVNKGSSSTKSSAINNVDCKSQYDICRKTNGC